MGLLRLSFPYLKSRGLGSLLLRGRVLKRNANRAKQARLPQEVYLNVNNSSRLADLRNVEDRRTYAYKSYVQPFRDIYNRPARLKIYSKPIKEENKKNTNILPWRIAFYNSSRVAVCIRRKIRKEIMHAKGYAGGHVGPPKYNEASKIHC